MLLPTPLLGFAVTILCYSKVSKYTNWKIISYYWLVILQHQEVLHTFGRVHAGNHNLMNTGSVETILVTHYWQKFWSESSIKQNSSVLHCISESDTLALEQIAQWKCKSPLCQSQYSTSNAKNYWERNKEQSITHHLLLYQAPSWKACSFLVLRAEKSTRRAEKKTYVIKGWE